MTDRMDEELERLIVDYRFRVLRYETALESDCLDAIRSRVAALISEARAEGAQEFSKFLFRSHHSR